ncbi:MAG: zinc-dependent metalloprotease [Actinomycetales bacterium]|nr:zinc-dependent metalloprotease [Actinomycetales bacterium]
MSNNEGDFQPDPEEFKRFLEKFMSNRDGLDAEQLGEFAELARDPQQLAAIIQQLQEAINANPGGSETGVNWKLTIDQAKVVARKDARAISDEQRKSVADAAHIGGLWLDQATNMSALSSEPKLIGRELWIDEALPLFQALSAPVANRMSDALSKNLVDNAPEELSSILGSASGMIKSAGSAMFAMQLGQALGLLSSEVISGGDIGLPLFQEPRAALVAQNLAETLAELDVETDQAYIYLVVRELAHARLFKHAKWLRDAIVLQITAYASDLAIDNSRLADLAGELEGSDLESLKKAIEQGAFIAAPNDEQRRALESIENLLALIEGWVEVVTADACKLLPKSDALGEFVRRRRATGGPAEKTFGQLIGLELRPRRLREAAALWRSLGTQLGNDGRDSLWDHPDLLPRADEITNSDAIIARLQASAGGDDELDRELRNLLGE